MDGATFTAASMLGRNSITWQSIWWEGELIVAQTRRRYEWAFSSRAPAGVTGVTRVAATVADPEIDELARASILAIDPAPHGVFGVDMTYSRMGAQPHGDQHRPLLYDDLLFHQRRVEYAADPTKPSD